MWKSGELHRLGGAVGAARKGDPKDFGGCYGIVGEGLVEIAHTKQQHGVGMLLLHLEVLLHQRGFNYFLSHKSGRYFSMNKGNNKC